MGIADKVLQVRFNSDASSHVKVDLKLCEACKEKPCLYVCPVQNFTLKEGRLEFAWDRCMECGACRVACRAGGRKAIEWRCPRGGYGISLRQG